MYFFTIIFVFLLVYMSYSYLFGKPHPKFPPGPIRWPIWGGYLQLLLENYHYPYQALHWMARRYNTEVLGVYLGPFPTVVACSNDSVRELLTRPEFQGRVKGFIPQTRDPDGVIRGQFFIDGPSWTEQRRFMLRNLRDLGFGTRSKKFEKIIEEELRDFIDTVQSNVEGVCLKGQVLVPLVFYPFFLNLTLHLVLGSRLPPHLHDKLRSYALTALDFQKSVDPTTGLINMTPWVRHLAPQISGYTDCVRANHAMKKFIKELVEEHKETFLSDELRDFCDIYLKELNEKSNSDGQHWFSEEQLVMVLWELLFPTSMTVSATLGFTMQYLLHNRQVIPKVQRELDQVVGNSRLPTLDDRKDLPYTEAVLREVMRRETVVPLALAHRCTEDTHFRGYFIPKDTMMLANIWSAHMDDIVWDDPFDFIPERHLNEKGELKRKDLSMPFGLGKRVCSAETFSRQNMFLLFAATLQHFTPEVPEGHALPDIEHPVPGVNMSPNPSIVKFTPR